LAPLSWYALESKPGKKRKERGRIQVSIQFMRNNMTASMFDLSMKDKPRSPFSKLKSKMKGNRKHDSSSETSSAILPRSALCDPPDSQRPLRGTEAQARPEVKAKRPLLAGSHKLSAAHSMSDLIGTHFRPKLDSMNSIDESGEERLNEPRNVSCGTQPDCRSTLYQNSSAKYLFYHVISLLILQCSGDANYRTSYMPCMFSEGHISNVVVL